MATRKAMDCDGKERGQQRAHLGAWMQATVREIVDGERHGELYVPGSGLFGCWG